MNTKDRKKALGELKKFVLAKQAEGAHDEIRAHIEARVSEVGAILGYAPEHVLEVLASEYAIAEQHIATLELYRAFLTTLTPSDVAASRGQTAQVQAEVLEYVRSHTPSLLAAFGVQNPKSLELYAQRAAGEIHAKEHAERWRGYVTRRFVDTLKTKGRELTAASRDVDLERAQEAARQLGAVYRAGEVTFDAEKFFATCLLGQQDEDTCVFVREGFDAADGWRDGTSVYVAMWRLKDAARALKGKKIEARVFENNRGRRLCLSWTNAFGRTSSLNLRGYEPKIGARVVIIQASPAQSEVAA